MKTLKSLLYELEACEELIRWIESKTVEKAVEQCHRGDWLLWLARKINVCVKKRTLAKARCAKTVLHLLKDQRSIDAINLAEKFGLTDEVSSDDLQSMAENAYNSTRTTYATANAAIYAAYAAYAAADIDIYDAAVYTAFAAIHAVYADDDNADVAAKAASFKNQRETADICRETFGKELIESINNILKN